MRRGSYLDASSLGVEGPLRFPLKNSSAYLHHQGRNLKERTHKFPCEPLCRSVPPYLFGTTEFPPLLTAFFLNNRTTFFPLPVFLVPCGGYFPVLLTLTIFLLRGLGSPLARSEPLDAISLDQRFLVLLPFPFGSVQSRNRFVESTYPTVSSLGSNLTLPLLSRL